MSGAAGPPAAPQGRSRLRAYRGVLVSVLEGPYLSEGHPTPEAVKHYEQIVASLDELRGFAAERLLQLYNDVWWDESIGNVDRSSFIERLTSPSVTLYDAIGFALIYFEDSDLFGGHLIEVTWRDGRPTDAVLAG